MTGVQTCALPIYEASQGMRYDERDVPESMLDSVKAARESMIESAAEASEELMNKYLESGELAAEDIKNGIRIRTLANEIVPMLCGSAFKNKGVQAMLDAVIDFLPSPLDKPAIQGLKSNGEKDERHASDEEPFSSLAFKIATDPYVGQLIFFRVYSGVVNSGDTVYNSVKQKKERVGRLLQMHANQRDEIKEVRAGDIAAAVGLKEVITGDTLCDTEHIITLERMDFPLGHWCGVYGSSVYCFQFYAKSEPFFRIKYLYRKFALPNFYFSG